MEKNLEKIVTKLFNSKLVKNIYPMLDRIEIDNVNFKRIPPQITLNIFLNDPTITKENMYRKEFDPHYLVEYHLKRLLKHVELRDIYLTFKLFGPDGDLILDWS